METAKSQAEERGERVEDELLRLVVHGFVHLLGYDHELSPLEARRMQRVEKYLLSR
jgi:probable rRNA maturation factor